MGGGGLQGENNGGGMPIGANGGPMGDMGDMNHPGNGGNGMDPGGNGMESSDMYGMYGVPQQHPSSRLSPAPFPTHGHYGNNTNNSNRPGPEVYEFEYEEPHFT